jgi:hypothetical protein
MTLRKTPISLKLHNIMISEEHAQHNEYGAQQHFIMAFCIWAQYKNTKLNDTQNNDIQNINCQHNDATHKQCPA